MQNRQKSIGHYILGKTIGEGTFGKVKLGTHILTGEKVAVKVLEKERIVDVADVERVAREIHILKLIRHPHIVQLYEIIETPKQLYLIMEYASGGELFDYIVANSRVSEREAVKFFHQILAGVDKVHDMYVVHRDLKPENLLLDEQKNIKIVDFGLSNNFHADQLLKTACGSPCYAAPEMIAGKKYVPSLCDIWSCGVILFAMVCGYLPFEDQVTSNLYKKILNAQYQCPDTISELVRDLIAGILSTDPTKRMTSQTIRQHPWYLGLFKSNDPVARPPDLQFHTGFGCEVPSCHRCKRWIIRSNTKERIIEDDVMDQLEKYSFPKDYALKCLDMNKHNHVTTTYYLLLEKKTRLMERLHSTDEIREQFFGFDKIEIPQDGGIPVYFTGRQETPSNPRTEKPSQGRGETSSAARGENSSVGRDIHTPRSTSASTNTGSVMDAKYIWNGQAPIQQQAPVPTQPQTARESKPPQSAPPKYSASARGTRTQEPLTSRAAPVFNSSVSTTAQVTPRRRTVPVNNVAPRVASVIDRLYPGKPVLSSRISPVAKMEHEPRPQSAQPASQRIQPPYSSRGGQEYSYGSQTHRPLSATAPTSRGPPIRQTIQSSSPVATRHPTDRMHIPGRQTPVRDHTRDQEKIPTHRRRPSDGIPTQRNSSNGTPTQRNPSNGSSVLQAPMLWPPTTPRDKVPMTARTSHAGQTTDPGMPLTAREPRDTRRVAKPALQNPGTLLNGSGYPTVRTGVAMSSHIGQERPQSTRAEVIHTGKSSKFVMQELQRCLNLHRVTFKQQPATAGSSIRCQKTGVRFEVEVRNDNEGNAIRFKRTNGDLMAYKEMFSRLTSDMRI